jgi:Flp pilus assembly protein TadB
MQMLNTARFTVGGTIDPTRALYIPREADVELIAGCLAGEFCYVLSSRQSGKSSLMVATMHHLRDKGVKVVSIDLSGLGTTRSGERQWYMSLLDTIVEQLTININVEEWWRGASAEEDLWPPPLLFRKFLQQEVLARGDNPLVIFIDEIDATLELSFSDNFFALIRSIYNARATEPEFRRLTFVLLGVAEPSQLIQDERHTPFNVGIRISLTDFSQDEAAQLSDALRATKEEAPRLVDAILHWTDGHPYLTQLMCRSIAQSPRADDPVTAVRQLALEVFFVPGVSHVHLSQVRDRFLRGDPLAALNTYEAILSGTTVLDDDRLVSRASQLKLSGLVKGRAGRLVPRNRIYEHVFSLTWIENEKLRLGERREDSGEPVDAVSIATAQPSRRVFRGALILADRIAGVLASTQIAHSWTRRGAAAAKTLPYPSLAYDETRAWPGIRIASSVLLCMVAMAIGASEPVVTGGIAAMLCWITANACNTYRLARRRKLLNEQIPQMVDLLSRALRAGHALPTCLGMAASEIAAPLGAELKVVYDQSTFGLTMSTALKELRRRVNHDDLSFVIDAILVQRETGGNLAEIMDRVWNVINARAGRELLTPVFVYWAPLCTLICHLLVLFHWYISPDYFQQLWLSRQGRSAWWSSVAALSAVIVVNALVAGRRSPETEMIGRVRPIYSVLDIANLLIGICIWVLPSVPIAAKLWLLILFSVSSRRLRAIVAASVTCAVALIATRSVGLSDVGLSLALSPTSLWSGGFGNAAAATVIVLGAVGLVIVVRRAYSNLERWRNKGRSGSHQLRVDTAGMQHRTGTVALGVLRGVVGLAVGFMAAAIILSTAARDVSFQPRWMERVAVAAAALCGVVGGLCIPTWIFRIRAAWERQLIADELVSAIELISMYIGSGLAFDQAIARISGSDTPLSRQFRYLSGEIRGGKSRLEALKNMADRVQIKQFRSLVAMFIQSDRFGTSVSGSIAMFANVARQRESVEVTARANRMLFVVVVSGSLLALALVLWVCAPLIGIAFGQSHV